MINTFQLLIYSAATMFLIWAPVIALYKSENK